MLIARPYINVSANENANVAKKNLVDVHQKYVSLPISTFFFL